MNTHAAPTTLPAFRAMISTPFLSHKLPASWSKEEADATKEWGRQEVSKGNAVRFNQKWPKNKTEAEGKTLISTDALAIAIFTETVVELGGRPYRVKLVGKDLYCTHSRAPEYADAASKAIWMALRQAVGLIQHTQLGGTQQFLYNDATSQFLIHTPLKDKQGAKVLKVLTEKLAALEEEANAPEEEVATPVETVPAAQPSVADQAANATQDAAMGECWECGARAQYSQADVQERDGKHVYVCAACTAEGIS